MATRAFSKFLTVFLALLQLVRSLGRRTKNPNPRRILVVHHLLLGDTLMLTPLLAKLRERFPRAEIAMTTPVGFVPLYRERPYGVDARSAQAWNADKTNEAARLRSRICSRRQQIQLVGAGTGGKVDRGFFG